MTFRFIYMSFIAAIALPNITLAQRAPGEQYISRVPGMAEYRVRKFETDSQGMTHTWADQLYRGVPVFGGEAIVHLKRDGSLASIDEEAVLDVNVTGSIRYSATNAIAIADNQALVTYGGRGEESTSAQLFVFRFAGRDRYTYFVHEGTIDTKDGDVVPGYWIDAETGTVTHAVDCISRALAQGPSLYFGNTFFFVEQSSPFFYMQDFSRNMQCLSARDTRSQRYDVIDPDLLFFAPEHEGPIDCWFNGELTYEYFKQVHNWTGVDGQNGPKTERLLNGEKSFTLICDYGKPATNNARNAFWNPAKKQAFFGGAADWVGVKEFVSCDVVGHEMTHGVVEKLADLAPLGETHSMNESLADVFGALVELFRDGVVNSGTWIIGEDVLDDGSAGFRDMLNPESLGQPDHKSEFDNFNSDPHFNAGIPNRAFTLAALGGVHTNSPNSAMVGIGIDKAAKVWFRAVRYHMGRITSFSRAKRATKKAAEELFGENSVEAARVNLAWEKCGV